MLADPVRSMLAGGEKGIEKAPQVIEKLRNYPIQL